MKLYLSEHRLSQYISKIVRREYANPSRMKPDPAPIHAAIEALGVASNRCAFIGDSLSDITAGRAAAVPVIGYANRPWKAAKFIDGGANLIVESMYEVASALVELSQDR